MRPFSPQPTFLLTILSAAAILALPIPTSPDISELKARAGCDLRNLRTCNIAPSRDGKIRTIPNGVTGNFNYPEFDLAKTGCTPSTCIPYNILKPTGGYEQRLVKADANGNPLMEYFHCTGLMYMNNGARTPYGCSSQPSS